MTELNNKETKLAFWGTSLTEHLEAYTPSIYDQMNLPDVNSTTLVTEWRKRGFVSMIENRLIASNPHMNIKAYNHGKGGANSFDILEIIQKNTSNDEHFDISFLECGINDILRKFQKRYSEAVDIDTFKENYRKSVDTLLSISKSVVCMSMTPINDDFKDDINKEMSKYNDEVKKIAQEKNCVFIDIFSEFSKLSQSMNTEQMDKLWSDKSHLSELGDTIVANIIINRLDHIL